MWLRYSLKLNMHGNKAGQTNPAHQDLVYGARKHVLETKEISEMNWRKRHYAKKTKKTGINPASRKLFSPGKRSSSQPKSSLARIIACLYSSCHRACSFQYTSINPQSVYPPEADFNVSETVEITTSAQIPPSLPVIAQHSLSVEHFISKFPKFIAGEILLTEKETRLQSESNEWKEQRQGRVTGSIAHRVMTRVKTITTAPHKEHDITPLLSQIMGYTSPPDNLPGLQYGRSMEAEARQSYRDYPTSSGRACVSVIECGLCLDNDKSFIAANPDGFVHCDCCGDGLLEIKCPISIAHENPNNVELAYLQLTDGGYTFRKNHSYYSQIQFQLGVTQKSWCDFFVFTRYGQITLRVQFDEVRWDQLITAPEYFFNNYIASELVTRSLQRELSRKGHIPTGCAEIGPFDVPMSVISDTPTAIAITSVAISHVKPLARPTQFKAVISSRRKRKRTKHAFSPLYSCSLYGNLCNEVSDLSTNVDCCVQCVSESCLTLVLLALCWI